jgi:hypothetical protein
MVELIGWMVNSRVFTKNEIREAAGYEVIPDPAMDVVYDGAGNMPVSELGNPPDPALTEETMKVLKIDDYRK